MNEKIENLPTWGIKPQNPLLQFKVPSIRPQRSLTVRVAETQNSFIIQMLSLEC